MSEQLAEIVWLGLAAYFGSGLIVALATLVFGLRRLDAAAAAMPLRVRLIIAPGLAGIWPVVLVRLLGVRATEDRT